MSQPGAQREDECEDAEGLQLSSLSSNAHDKVNIRALQPESHASASWQHSASSFDFDAWIEENELTAIKPILVRHDLTNTQNLNTNSAAFASFVSDPVLFQSYFHQIAPTVTAIQQLSMEETKGDQLAESAAVNESKYVVISDAEERIINSLQTHLDHLQAKQAYLDELKEKFAASLQSMQQRKAEHIKTVKSNISSFFDELQHTILSKKSSLTEELETFRVQNEEEEEEEEKESQIVSDSASLIANIQSEIDTALTNCHQIIDASSAETTQTAQRRKQLNAIYDTVLQRYAESNKRLEQMFENIEQAINEHDSMVFVLDFGTDSLNALSVMENVNNLQLTNGTEGMQLEPIAVSEGTQIDEINEAVVDEMKEVIAKQERIIDSQAQEIKLFQQEFQRQQNEQQRNVQIIARQQREIEEKQRTLLQRKERIKTLEGMMTVARSKNNTGAKKQGAVKKGGNGKKKQKKSVQRNWRNYLLQRVSREDVSALNEYAAAHCVTDPKFTYKTNKTGPKYTCTLSFCGVRVVGRDNRQTLARWASVSNFIHKYVE